MHPVGALLLEDLARSLGKWLDRAAPGRRDKRGQHTVDNEIRGDDFRILDKSGEKERAIGMGATVIHIKRLHEVSMIKIDASSASFWAVANKSDADTSGLGLLERQRVKVWLKNSFSEIAKPGV